MAMARLAWIRVRAGIRNRPSGKNMIAQKPRPDEGRVFFQLSMAATRQG
jgi:hypothetical protein